MIRRRRRTREIPFSFDSFLDIVANVVGIIIRLILVVWVGARSYSSVQMLARKAATDPQATASGQQLQDPLQQELAEHRRQLARAQERLLEQLRRLQQCQDQEKGQDAVWTTLAARRQQLAAEQRTLMRAAEAGQARENARALSLAELRERSRRLAEEIQEIEKLPAPQKTLRYRTPISRPLHSEELHFECRGGRVTFIDVAGLMAQVREGMEDKGKLLRSQWQLNDVTGTIGPFRLRYTLERERGLLDTLSAAAPPSSSDGFRYGVTGWEVEAMAFQRGETLEAALAADSSFRQVVDGIDPEQTAVTFWVYPDSFALFRRLRDYLYDRDITVAGRPLPFGVPIASTRQGSASRGQ